MKNAPNLLVIEFVTYLDPDDKFTFFVSNTFVYQYEEFLWCHILKTKTIESAQSRVQ